MFKPGSVTPAEELESLETVDTVVIGAGVIGLAVARALALARHEVLILEAQARFGTQTSARNSDVIHAGLYYPPGSLKARLLAPGAMAQTTVQWSLRGLHDPVLLLVTDALGAWLLSDPAARWERLLRLRNRVQFGSGSGASSQAGGPRAGATLGGRDGSPMWVRIRSTGAASVIKATMRMSAPQLGQVSGRDSNSRASSMAQR